MFSLERARLSMMLGCIISPKEAAAKASKKPGLWKCVKCKCDGECGFRFVTLLEFN